MQQPTPWLRLTSAAVLALALNVAIFYALSAIGLTTVTTHLLSFVLGTFVGYSLVGRGTLAGTANLSAAVLCSRFFIVFFLSLFFYAILLAHLLGTSDWPLPQALIIAVFAGQLVQLIGVITVVFAVGSWLTPSANHWKRLAIIVVGYIVAFKIAAMGPVNLIPEEAYYWNYAQHLDLSYLDHPPMVAWLIWISTSLFGKSEFSVRLPALISWAVAAAFMFRLTSSIFDRNAGFRCLLLITVLPFYFGFGFFMTPDTPLLAAWAGCLYFLYRALIVQSRNAWWGASICMGLGLLSKYTILLLGFAAVGYLLVDRRSRQWWARTEPYFATVLSAIIFLPVLIWNARQGWASFVFQGPRRWSDDFDFSLPFLIGSILLVLTPVGVAAAAQALVPPRRDSALTQRQPLEYRRQWLFGALFTLMPLSVFFLFSLFHTPKINWTAPVWLAILPWIAQSMGAEIKPPGKILLIVQRLWILTIITLLLTMSAGFYYIYLGLPGAGQMAEGRLLGPWRTLGMNVDAIQRKFEIETGTRPLIVGMDKYMITSELTFYDHLNSDRVKNSGAPHLFGDQGLMWEYWFPSSAQIGKNIILIDLRTSRLTKPELSQFFDRLSDVSTENLDVDGRKVGNFYWRIGYGYRGLPNATKSSGD